MRVAAAIGRRPKGYEAPAIDADVSSLARYFALCAHVESASVVAFDVLRVELELHDFPREVLDACTRAARQETAHAEVAGALATRFGAEAPPFDIQRYAARHARAAPRALVDTAIENAIEGCVGEVFGAAEVLFRARRTTDREVRIALARMAIDEIDHAELSLEIARLMEPRLDAGERARVRAARDTARLALRSTLERRKPDAALAAVAGMPGAEDATAIFDALW